MGRPEEEERVTSLIRINGTDLVLYSANMIVCIILFCGKQTKKRSGFGFIELNLPFQSFTNIVHSKLTFITFVIQIVFSTNIFFLNFCERSMKFILYGLDVHFYSIVCDCFCNHERTKVRFIHQNFKQISVYMCIHASTFLLHPSSFLIRLKEFTVNIITSLSLIKL